VAAMNAALRRRLAYERDEVEGMPLVDLVPTEERFRVAEHLKARAEGREAPTPRFTTTYLLDREGSRNFFEGHISVVPAAEGGLPYTVAQLHEPNSPSVEHQELLVEIATGMIGERTSAGVLAA